MLQAYCSQYEWEGNLRINEAWSPATRPRAAVLRLPVQIASNIWRAISADNISLLAAGVAFYALLALFPGLAFIVAMFGLVSDPAQIQQQLLSLKDVLPAQAWAAVDAQLTVLTRQTSATLSLASLISLGLAFVNARLGVYSMMGALNVVYRCEETRSFFRTNLIAFAFTLAASIIFAINVYAIAAVPGLLKNLGFTSLPTTTIHALRWPALALLMVLSLALTYRFGPDRKNPRWLWLSVGSLAATALWLAGSAVFYWYVAAFNSYDRLYGSFGAVIILLYWLWLTAFAALTGAELDKHIPEGLAAGKEAK
jgi:membrane protein